VEGCRNELDDILRGTEPFVTSPSDQASRRITIAGIIALTRPRGIGNSSLSDVDKWQVALR